MPSERIESKKLFQEIKTCLVGGVNSPARAFLKVDIDPLIAQEAHEDLLVDVDGNAYIDYCAAWGVQILGHAHPKVLAACRQELGQVFGVTTKWEGLLAQKIISMMPSIEKVRFVTSGTESTMSAVRLAKAFTNRELLVKFSGNYHGHSDLFFSKRSCVTLPYNDCDRIEEFFQTMGSEVAAVIVEPVAGNMGVVPASLEFLRLLRKRTEECGALLLFDEVITGFRVGASGAFGLYGIRADLTCLGKIIGGGFPAAAFGGKKEIMDLLTPVGSCFHAGTMAGHPIAMQAGLATLELLAQPGVYEELAHKSRLLLDPIRQIEGMKVVNVGSMWSIFVKDDEQFAHFFRYLLAHGIYIPQSQQEAAFLMLAHSEEHLLYTAQVVSAYGEILHMDRMDIPDGAILVDRSI